MIESKIQFISDIITSHIAIRIYCRYSPILHLTYDNLYVFLPPHKLLPPTQAVNPFSNRRSRQKYPEAGGMTLVRFPHHSRGNLTSAVVAPIFTSQHSDTAYRLSTHHEPKISILSRDPVSRQQCLEFIVSSNRGPRTCLK